MEHRQLGASGFKVPVLSLGTGTFGGQGSFTERSVFAGIGGGPNTNEGIFMAALRYYPFAP